MVSDAENRRSAANWPGRGTDVASPESRRRRARTGVGVGGARAAPPWAVSGKGPPSWGLPELERCSGKPPSEAAAGRRTTPDPSGEPGDPAGTSRPSRGRGRALGNLTRSERSDRSQSQIPPTAGGYQEGLEERFLLPLCMKTGERGSLRPRSASALGEKQSHGISPPPTPRVRGTQDLLGEIQT